MRLFGAEHHETRRLWTKSLMEHDEGIDVVVLEIVFVYENLLGELQTNPFSIPYQLFLPMPVFSCNQVRITTVQALFGI